MFIPGPYRRGRSGTLDFFIDGSSIGNEKKGQPRRARFAIAFRRPGMPQDSSNLKVVSNDLGDKTNNEAEYHALLGILSLISRHLVASDGRILARVGEIRIYSDSEILVKQMKGEYRVKEERLRKLHDNAMQMIERLGTIRLEWIPREENLAGLWVEGKLMGTTVTADQFLLGL